MSFPVSIVLSRRCGIRSSVLRGNIASAFRKKELALCARYFPLILRYRSLRFARKSSNCFLKKQHLRRVLRCLMASLRPLTIGCEKRIGQYFVRIIASCGGTNLRFFCCKCCLFFRFSGLYLCG